MAIEPTVYVVDDDEGPGHFGFDEYCLWQLNRRPGRYPNPGLEIKGKQVDYARGEYAPDLCTDYICDFMTRNKAIDDVEKSGSLLQPSGNR